MTSSASAAGYPAAVSCVEIALAFNDAVNDVNMPRESDQIPPASDARAAVA